MKRYIFFLLFVIILTGCQYKESSFIFSEKRKNIVIGLGLQLNYHTCNTRLLLEQRVDRVYDIGSKLDNVLYIFSGKSNPVSAVKCRVNQTHHTEARAMKKILIEKYGVSDKDILLEEKSTSTIENGIYIKQMVDELKETQHLSIKQMYLISSAYHNHRVNAQTGRDTSSISAFNKVFHDFVFEENVNVFSSSELSKEFILSQDAFLLDTQSKIFKFGDFDNNNLSDLLAIDVTSKESTIFLSKNGKLVKSHKVFNFPFKSDVSILDVDGDGNNDIVGVYNGALYLSIGDGKMNFSKAKKISSSLNHLNNIALYNVSGDAKPELIKFSRHGTYVSSFLHGEYSKFYKILDDFGSLDFIDFSKKNVFGGADSDFPRYVSDVTGDGYGDIIALGYNKIYVSVNKGNGTFKPKEIWLSNDIEGNQIDFVQGCQCSELNDHNQWQKAWNRTRHPRGVADINGDGRSDFWAIGEHGVYAAFSVDMNDDGTGDRFENLNGVWLYETKFRHKQENQSQYRQFTPYRGWVSVRKNPRMFSDINGDGKADLVGFGFDAVYAALAQNF